MKQMKNCIYRASAIKMSSGQIPYYDGYDNYDFPGKFRSIKTLKEIEKNK